MKQEERFWRKQFLANFAQRKGQEYKGPGGCFQMTPELIKEAEQMFVMEELEDRSIECYGIIHSKERLHETPNYGESKLTEEEIEWMDAILYGYGMPWGG